MASSPLYFPYKAIGYVTDGRPFVVNMLGDETFLTVSIGNSFQVYRFNKLTVVLVSRQIPVKGSITCLQVRGHDTFVAVGQVIYVYNRSEIVRTYESHSSFIIGMSMIGTILLSYDSDNKVVLTDVKARKELGSIQSIQPSRMSSVCHPATYVNKYLFGYENGEIELWNIKTQKILYTFKAHIACLQKLSSSGSSSSSSSSSGFSLDNIGDDSTAAVATAFQCPAITSLEQSPACDVIAVGFSSGDVLVMNVKLDRVLCRFKQDGGAVTSISFRTDAGLQKFPFMATSSSDGRIHMWHLGGEQKSVEDGGTARGLKFSIDDAHRDAARVSFLQGEPIMVSLSTDNSIKVWIFDAADGSARLLRSREGHHSHPLRIRYYGGGTSVSMRDNATGHSCEIISAGSDGSLRLFNSAIEAQNTELSQKTILKKYGMQRRRETLPVIQGFDYAEARESDWANVATIHQDHSNVYLWRWKKRAITDIVLRQPGWSENEKMRATDRKTHATSVALTCCGNFCLVGTRGGYIYMYNVQSGLPRGSFPSSNVSYMKEGKVKHLAAQVGNVFQETKKLLTGTSKGPVEREKAAYLKHISAHSSDVTGVFVDASNSIMVSASMDGRAIFWDFSTQNPIEEVEVGSSVLFVTGYRDAGFVALACQDRYTRVYDVVTRNLVRRFGGHTREITDIMFTPDGRRLLTASMDSTLRVWDMSTARCLSWMVFNAPITSLAPSLSGDFLVVTQFEKEGLFMYADRSMYESVLFSSEPASPTVMLDSLVVTDEELEEMAANDFNDHDSSSDDDGEDVSKGEEQDGDGEEFNDRSRAFGDITMSGAPRAYWTTLFNLEEIKARNKPTEAPSAPVLAPFFLPTVHNSGSLPSFPTPQEYASVEKEVLEKSKATTTAVVSKRKAEEDPGDHEEDEEQITSELAAMGSSGWGNDGGWSDSNSDSDEDDENEPVIAVQTNKSQSRILHGLATMPRCRMVPYLGAHFGGNLAVLEDLDIEYVNASLENEQQYGETDVTESALMSYLKSLMPPSVDVEFRALCLSEEDKEGLGLLRALLIWFKDEFARCDNFEVLQAYLARTISIYSDLILKTPQLQLLLENLKLCHGDSSNRFRKMVQSNLAILKFMGKLPSL